jgi:hypothetical protein
MCSTPADDALGVVEAGLDALAAEDAPVGDGERLARVRRLVVAQNRIAAELAAAVRDAECRQAAEHDGLRSMRTWLRSHSRLSGAAVNGLVRQGRAVTQLPALEAAFAAGQVTADQVEVIAEITRPENLDRAAAQGIDLAVVEQALVTIAVTQPHSTLQRAVGGYLARLDPDGPEPDPTEDRSLVLAQHPDGAYTLGGSLDQVGGDKVATALESLAAAGRAAGDPRSRAQRLADALVQLCDLALASGRLPILRTVKPQLVVTIDHTDLADPHTGPGAASTGTGGLLSAARARWAGCDATITRILLDPDGQPLDVGRSQRVVPPHLRRAVEVRDRGCVFTGCTAPTWWCDVHHLLEWANGGQTSLDNSALLCERHHTKVHHGFRVERQPDGRWRTWRPDGTEIRLAPPAQRAA